MTECYKEISEKLIHNYLIIRQLNKFFCSKCKKEFEEEKKILYLQPQKNRNGSDAGDVR
jgi:glutathionylspermidine synthase